MIVIAALTIASVASAGAQTTSPTSTKRKGHSVPGSPLDTLMSSHLTATVAPTKDFVRETHPDPRTLTYAPLTGTDPERPKLRDPANIAALQAELEQGIDKNAKRAKALGGVKPSRKASAAAKN